MKHAALALILLLAACATQTPYQAKVEALSRALDWAIEDANEYVISSRSTPSQIVRIAKYEVEAEDAVRAARVCKADCDPVFNEAQQAVRLLEAVVVEMRGQ